MASEAAAPAIDIPAFHRPRALRSVGPLPLLPLPLHAQAGVAAEEYDFSDVFGPVLSGRHGDPGSFNGSGDGNEITDLTHETAELQPQVEELATWAPPDSISEGEPLVIYHRSHSLVGPALTYRDTPTQSFRQTETTGSARVTGALSTSGPDGRDETNITLASVVHSMQEGLQVNGCSVPLQQPIGPSDSDEGSGEDVAGKDVSSVLTACDSVVDLSTQDSVLKMGPHDFEFLRVVGQGAFGKVFQVQEKNTREIYAMKVMRKDRIIEKNHGDYMRAEKEILTKVVHPFIVQLRYSFQTKSKLYLLLDFINGGHLFFQLYRQGTFSEELARVYTAELVLAVAHLHNMGIIHRDLKPENILLDSEGHVKLTDFGLAKEVDKSDTSNSMCGTMEYMAPEILLAKGHGRSADWWSVGILLYEMLTGQPPFAHKNRQKLQLKIVKDKIKLPTYLTSEANTLLKGLLQKDASKRLGSGPNGSTDIMAAKWFKGMNWRKLEAREVHPNFRPDVNGKECTANFDEMWTKLPVDDSPAGTPTQHNSELFRGYTYTAPRSWLPSVDSDSHSDDHSDTSDGER